ncbi:TolC family protein [Carboxylicivirga sp. N1Y90]|uniref:TolC family protein n=1 Tax=Carboxylicivirga fragile TaxID=3417571 RepID=UPI003D3363AA|nr:TolC family protein [Marinilabiliaceae bacterium N1Y90]
MNAQKAMTLNEAILQGLMNNFEIQIGQKNNEISRVQNTWGNAGRWPSVNLQAGMNNSLNDRFGTTNETGWFSAGVAVNWVLFDGFAVRIRKHRLDDLEKMSDGNAAIVVENTIQAIILGYNKALLEKERLNVFESVMKLSKDRYDYIQHKFDLGAGSSYEVLQAKGDWLTDKTNFLNQEMTLRSAKRLLSYLLALPPETDFELTSPLEPGLMDYQLAVIKDKMEVENRTLQNQYLNLAVLDKAIALEQSARYPRLSLGTGISTNYYPDALNTNESAAALSGSYSLYANLALSYNVFDGNRVNRNIEIARIQKEIGTIQLDDVKSRLVNQLYDFYDLYNVRKELYLLQVENLETAQLNLEISTEKYRNGAITSFDFRNTQRSYLETALRQVQSIYNLIDANTNIVRITGGIISEYDQP